MTPQEAQGDSAQPKPARIFVSYAHEDESWRQALFAQALELPDGIQLAWTDDRIQPGSDWEGSIREALRDATVAVLLVSRHFLKSIYITRKELPALLDKRLADGLKLLWIPIGRLEDLGEHKLASIQSAHSLRHPLPAHPNRTSDSVEQMVRQIRYEVQAAIDPLGVPLMNDLSSRFEPFVRIARTDMVAVYRSLDRHLQRSVAIKVLCDRDKADAYARSARDAAVVADEPHFVKLYDAVLTGTHPYCIMQFVDGQSLRRWIDADRCRPLSIVMKILSQVTRALVSAHARGSGYGNLRPSNVILSRNNRAFVQPMGLRVNEFRGARLVDELTLRSPDAEMMAYLAPEQFDKEIETVSAEHTDQYTLGLLAFELITGAMPPAFQAKATVAESLAVLRLEGRAAFMKLPRPTILRPDCPEIVATVIERMTCTNPGDRYRTLKDVLIDMRRMEDIALARARESFGRCIEHQASTGRSLAQAVFAIQRERQPGQSAAMTAISADQHAGFEDLVRELFVLYEQERGHVPRLQGPGRSDGNRRELVNVDASFASALVDAVCGSVPSSACDPRCALEPGQAPAIRAAWREVLRPGTESMTRCP
ncbi:MAG: TIR domain-containing protein [Burkholderiales bacterium]|nr:TIR domain-containing protein [Burkholderiales bacterium]